MHDQVFRMPGRREEATETLPSLGPSCQRENQGLRERSPAMTPSSIAGFQGPIVCGYASAFVPQPNAIDPRGGPKDPVRFQLIDDHGSLIRWRDHDDPTEIGGPSRRIGEKTAQQDAAHRVGDHVNAGRLAEPLPLQQLREPGAGQVLQGKRAGRIRSIDHPVAGALE